MEPVIMFGAMLLVLLWCMCDLADDIERAWGEHNGRLTLYLVGVMLALAGMWIVGFVSVVYALPGQSGVRSVVTSDRSRKSPARVHPELWHTSATPNVRYGVVIGHS